MGAGWIVAFHPLHTLGLCNKMAALQDNIYLLCLPVPIHMSDGIPDSQTEALRPFPDLLIPGTADVDPRSKTRLWT